MDAKGRESDLEDVVYAIVSCSIELQSGKEAGLEQPLHTDLPQGSAFEGGPVSGYFMPGLLLFNLSLARKVWGSSPTTKVARRHGR